MSSRRWSTTTLVAIAFTVGTASFYAGRNSRAHPGVPQQSTAAHQERGATKSNEQPLPTIETAAISPAPWENRWTEITANPPSPIGKQAMADLIEELAKTNPQKAISLAANQPNFELRAALLRAALKGWGQIAPEAGVEWAESQTVMDQAQAITALLQGAVQDPTKAAMVTGSLIEKHPDRAIEFGTDLISAFTESGQFERAAEFAMSASVNQRDDWMLPAYSRWAEFRPQAAAASALQIADPALRDTALNAIIVGWAPTDPKALIEFSRANLSSEQQNVALSTALGFWADGDPIAAANWINQNNPSAASDTGVAEIALSSQLAKQPNLAASWAESILNPQLRLETLKAVLDKWATVDPTSAANYLDTSSAITPEERALFYAQAKKQSEP